MTGTFTLTTFTPGEAETVTGLSTTMQRDWRRRRFLSAPDGKQARFDAFGLASLWTAKMLADRGIGPAESHGILQYCAAGIVWHALQLVDAYEGDHQRALEWQDEVLGRVWDDDVAGPVEQAAKDAGIELPEGWRTSRWGHQANWLARMVLKRNGMHFAPGRFFVWPPEGEPTWTHDAAAVFERTDVPAGPVIILDLESLGNELVERTARPLVHVEFDTPSNGKE